MSKKKAAKKIDADAPRPRRLAFRDDYSGPSELQVGLPDGRRVLMSRDGSGRSVAFVDCSLSPRQESQYQKHGLVAGDVPAGEEAAPKADLSKPQT